MKRNLRPLFVLVAVAAMFVSACSSDDDTSSSTTAADSATNDDADAASDLQGTLTVSAAASLTDAFTQIGDQFMAANPDLNVTFNFDSSSILATQIIEGAPADIYASADEANMDKLTAEDLVAGEPETFARNELIIVTKPGNPEGITGLADLADAGVISLCGEDAPCGKYADQVLADAGVTIPEGSITRGQNVTATLTAVAEGDAVAGIVYASDAVRAGDSVEAVAIPTEQNVIAVYPIGVIDASKQSEAADAFVEFVLGPDGQAVLKEFGFLSAS